jgi:hypothetical protein
MTLTHVTELVVLTCWCGMPHAVPSQLREHQLRQHHEGRTPESIYCPLGHTHVPAGPSEVEKQKKRAVAAEARAQAIADQLQSEQRSHSATKGQLTKTKKRIGNGVCPCCNRHFTNVERHMASKHPDYAGES